jgi:hypothetical protein
MPRRGRASSRNRLSLDSVEWLPIPDVVNRPLCILTGNPHAAAKALTSAMANGVPAMRESLTTGERELVPSSHWQDHELIAEWPRPDGVAVFAREPVIDHGIMRTMGAPVRDFVYFVWRPALAKRWSAAFPAAAAGADDKPQRRRPPGPPPEMEWRTLVAREIIRRMRAGEPMPKAPKMCEFCQKHSIEEPSLRTMQGYLRALLA